jgi:hypothetical protein
MTRLSTLRTAAEIWINSIAHDGRHDEKADWATRVAWVAGGVIGAGLFFGSFAFLAMPAISGWSWLAAWGCFLGAQMTSQVMLDLHSYWTKATAFLWMGRNLIRGTNISQELTQRRALIDPDSMPVTAPAAT